MVVGFGWLGLCSLLYLLIVQGGNISNSTLFVLIQVISLAGFGVLSIAVYGQLTRRFYRARHIDNETRYRKCNYILRGITEPRCPECGEAI